MVKNVIIWFLTGLALTFQIMSNLIIGGQEALTQKKRFWVISHAAIV